MATPQQKAQCVAWFIETKSDTQTQRNFRTKYGVDPPHQGRLLESGTGNSWTLAASWTKRGVVGQALVTPMWNECKMHSHVAQQSRSVLLLGNWRCRGLRYTRCFISVYVCMRTRFRSCRLSNQQTNHAERNSLWECLFRLTKNRNT